MSPAEFQQRRAEFSRRTIPELIDLLGSDSLQIRFLAEMALRDATST